MVQKSNRVIYFSDKYIFYPCLGLCFFVLDVRSQRRQWIDHRCRLGLLGNLSTTLTSSDHGGW